MSLSAQTVAATHSVDVSDPEHCLARLAMIPDSNLCVVGVRGASSRDVIMIDYLSGRVARRVKTGRNPDRIEYREHRIYITERDEECLGVYTLEGGSDKTVNIAGNPHGMAVSQVGDLACVGTLDGRIVVVDLGMPAIRTELSFSPQPALADLILASNDSAALAADLDHDRLLVFDPADESTRQQVEVEGGPVCMAFDPILRRVYCSCQKSRALGIVAFTRTESYFEQPIVWHVPVPSGALPVGLDVSPQAERVFVCTRDPDGLATFHVDSGEWYPLIPIDQEPTAVRCSNASDVAVVTAGNKLVVIGTSYGFGTSPAEAA